MFLTSYLVEVRQCKNYHTLTTRPFKKPQKLCGLGCLSSQAPVCVCVCTCVCECVSVVLVNIVTIHQRHTPECLNGVGWGWTPLHHPLCPKDSCPRHSANFRDKERQVEVGRGADGAGRTPKTGWEREGGNKATVKNGPCYQNRHRVPPAPTRGAPVTRKGGSPAPPPG